MKLRITLGNGQRLVLCLVMGILFGTIFANLLGKSFQQEVGIFSEYFRKKFDYGALPRQDLFRHICKQRFLEFLIPWLAGYTFFCIPVFCGLSFYYGCSIGMVLAMTTMQVGFMGLPCYLATILPQYLVYVPVWSLLAMGCMENRERMKMAGSFRNYLKILPIFGSLFFLGILLEVWVNPWVIQQVLRFL